MEEPTSMCVLLQDQTSKNSAIKERVFRSWIIWIAGMCLSFLPLLAIPFIRSRFLPGYSDWFTDVFGSTEIIMIAICTAVAALIALLIRNHKPKGALFIGVFLFVSTLFCIFAHGIITGIIEYNTIVRQLAPQDADLSWLKHPDFELSRLNIAFWGVVLIFGSLTFLPKKRL